MASIVCGRQLHTRTFVKDGRMKADSVLFALYRWDQKRNMLRLRKKQVFFFVVVLICHSFFVFHVDACSSSAGKMYVNGQRMILLRRSMCYTSYFGGKEGFLRGITDLWGCVVLCSHLRCSAINVINEGGDIFSCEILGSNQQVVAREAEGAACYRPEFGIK